MKTSHNIPATNDLPKLLTLKQLSEILNIGMRTIARMRSDGRIPKPLKIGGNVRWSAETILTWLENGAPDLRKKSGAA